MSNLFKIAENLLNTLDQSTQSSIQTALNKPTTDSSSTSGYQQGLKGSSSLSTSTASLSGTSVGSSVNLKSISGHKKTSSVSNNEEDLFKFLNDTSDTVNLSANDNSAARSSKSSLHKTDNSDTEDNVKFSVGDKSSKHSENEEEPAEKKETTETSETSSSPVNNEEEKKLLKNEIVSLNEEIKSYGKRVKALQEDFQRSKKKIEHYQNQISESDKIIRELRAREEDMVESIKSKDTQLAVLRVRFDEMDNELKSKRAELESLTKESERILRDHSNSSDMQSQVVERLKERLQDLETSFEREKENHAQLQKSHMEIQSRLESEKQSLSESLNTIEKKLSEEKTKSNELTGQLKTAKTAQNFLKQEFEEYKLKATKTLQAKDRLISTLKNSTSSNESGEDGGSVSMKAIEIDELKLERDSLREEINSKNVSLELLKSEMMELESQTSIEIELLKDQLRNMQESLEESHRSKEFQEQELRTIRQQLDYAQEESYKQKTSINNRLQEKELELEKLRSQLTARNLNNTTDKELENRLHLLTENLIQKQTLIEALQSEKHSIFLQLERVEKRLADYESIVASKKTSTSIRMYDDDEPNNKPQYLRESPYDHEVTRKVKKYASEIDKFSIRLGVFLKRYPIARIFVIFYMDTWRHLILKQTWDSWIHHLKIDKLCSWIRQKSHAQSTPNSSQPPSSNVSTLPTLGLTSLFSNSNQPTSLNVSTQLSQLSQPPPYEEACTDKTRISDGILGIAFGKPSVDKAKSIDELPNYDAATRQTRQEPGSS